jgi:two-component system, chemotaxis family, CheB/CheR fusion protein
MPGMDGHEAAARIRGADSGSDIVLVALSGYAQPADRARSREVGFDMHLVKPLDPAQLRDVLAVAAHGRQAFRDRFAEPA